ncbi:hypothetical protein FTV88_1223 [Heliorestis convoluta]|uniref:Uncharacterized protein n=2 Tax=Heliorestis convoluta TaxID=356322 RepID=A0A5Q2N546_9FIRM|nr:hypothetical protein FTV88_1223 [Heliorestis convoluta]
MVLQTVNKHRNTASVASAVAAQLSRENLLVQAVKKCPVTSKSMPAWYVETT